MKKILLLLKYIYDFTKAMIANYSFLLFFNNELATKFFIFSTIISASFLIYRIIYYSNYFNFEFTTNYLIVKKGIFLKKIYKVRYSKILGYEFHQNLLFRFFQIYQVQIFFPDTGDNKSITLPILNNEEKNYLSNKLLITDEETSNNEPNVDNLYPVIPLPIYKIVLSAFIRSNYLYIYTIYWTISEILQYLDIHFDKYLFIFYYSNPLYVSFFILIIILSLTSIAKQIWDYINFKVYNTEHSLIISNGIFQKNLIEINKIDISYLVLKQSLGQAVFKICSLHAGIFNVKSDSKNKINTLFPHQSINNFSNDLLNILPTFDIEDLPIKKLLKFPVYEVVCSLVPLIFIYTIVQLHFSIISFATEIIMYIFYTFLLECKFAKFEERENYIIIKRGLLLKKIFITDKSHLEWEIKYQFYNYLTIRKLGIKLQKFKKLYFLMLKNK
ncbi:PH domain-containing protein [Streptococcus suis]|uniref:YdbS-like PH domain-containing protein n=2 Tax=Streptococcus suis TaxID=1307 RepID=G7SFH3_STRSU|nr:PH domain-containing protein [Streptococcus suis]AER18881.1 hypothetical protein SSUD12_0558 [Streptococcus suis D12]MBY4960212.1 PH domain-containing protein [Streptococcus suis]MBY4960261.1 PH domain-containing protein [Streptococcus suis]MBY5028680.1 PH domain-containing protein [Streptococcus suis]MBY6288555.1 PH domain-containing protein [Streptococcus suis]